MGAYLIWYPDVPILTLVFFFPINIQARWLLVFWFISQFFIGPDQGVAWGAHVGGFVFGVVAALLLRQDRRGTYRLAG
jgi:membrane associated rhomboid family serine protease